MYRASLACRPWGWRRWPVIPLDLAPRTRCASELRGMSTPATERELHALAADSGLSLSPQLLGVVLELLRLDVTPQALLMMLRRVMVRSVELQRAPQ